MDTIVHGQVSTLNASTKNSRRSLVATTQTRTNSADFVVLVVLLGLLAAPSVAHVIVSYSLSALRDGVKTQMGPGRP